MESFRFGIRPAVEKTQEEIEDGEQLEEIDKKISELQRTKRGGLLRKRKKELKERQRESKG